MGRQRQTETDRDGQGQTGTRKEKLAGGKSGTNHAGTKKRQSGIIRK